VTVLPRIVVPRQMAVTQETALLQTAVMQVAEPNAVMQVTGTSGGWVETETVH
jgi:hypothetical protein